MDVEIYSKCLEGREPRSMDGCGHCRGSEGYCVIAILAKITNDTGTLKELEGNVKLLNPYISPLICCNLPANEQSDCPKYEAVRTVGEE